MSELKPIVVIVSSSSTKPKSLMKLITHKTDFSKDDQNITSQSWQIDTKYYTADISLHGINERYIRSDEFNQSVEALIVHMDSNKKTGLTDLKVWENIESDCDPEIKLLVSNYFTNDTKITRLKATEWCLKRGFELIELYPNVQKSKYGSDEDDEIIKEKLGVERIVEALQTHIWPNLQMKEAQMVFDKPKQQVADKEINNVNLSGNLLTSEGTDDFTELFTQLHTMKESIQSMPMRERKQCAEQMVTAFWRAIGGDEEEIADL